MWYQWTQNFSPTTDRKQKKQLTHLRSQLSRQWSTWGQEASSSLGNTASWQEKSFIFFRPGLWNLPLWNMPFFYKPKVGLHHPLDRAAMSIFGTNRPLHLEKTIDQHSLKNLYGIWGKQNLPQKTNNLFIVLQDGWWGLDFHRKLNQQNQYFQIAIIISVKCLSSSLRGYLQNQYWRITLGSTYSETLNVSFSLFVPALGKHKFLPERNFLGFLHQQFLFVFLHQQFFSVNNLCLFFFIINRTGHLVAQL